MLRHRDVRAGIITLIGLLGVLDALRRGIRLAGLVPMHRQSSRDCEVRLRFSRQSILAVGRPNLVFRVDCRRTRFDARSAPEMDPRLSSLSTRCAAKNV